MHRYSGAFHAVGLGCLGALFLLLALGARPAGAGDMLKVGDPAPPFTVAAVDGSTFSLTQALGGRAVLVCFLSSPCKPCEDNIPIIAKLCGRFSRSSRAQAVGIVMAGRDAIVKAFEGQQPVARPLLTEVSDAGHQAAEDYGVKGTPTFYLVGRDGKIAWRHVGRLDDEKMNAVLDLALGK